MIKQYKVVLVPDEDHPTGIELQNLENEDDKILTTDDGGFFVDEVYPSHQIRMTKVKSVSDSGFFTLDVAERIK